MKNDDSVRLDEHNKRVEDDDSMRLNGEAVKKGDFVRLNGKIEKNGEKW